MVMAEPTDSELEPQDGTMLLDVGAETLAEAGIAEGPIAEGEISPAGEPSSDASGAVGARPPPQQSPDELTQLRSENGRLAQEAARLEAANAQQRIQQAAAAYAENLVQHYVKQGLDEQVAEQIAASDTKAQVAVYLAQKSIHRAAVLEVSNEFKIPREQLERFQDEAAMRQFAQTYSQATGPQARQIEALQKQVAALTELTKRRVPAQNYDRGGQGRGGHRSYADRVKSGEDIPAEERDRLTAQYLR